MGKIIYSIMASVDGFIESRDKSLDWAIIDEEFHTFINDKEREIGAYLYGRGMYQTMNAFWPTGDQDPSQPGYIIDYARIWQQMPKVVFSTTLEKVEGKATLVKGNIAEAVRVLKSDYDKDLSLGGAGIAASFMKLGLVDGYEFFIHPVVLGTGTPLFPAGIAPVNLKLTETHRFGSGVMMVCYEQANG